MTILPQADSAIRAHLRSLLWRENVLLATIFTVGGVFAALIAKANSVAPIIAFPMGAGIGIAMGLYAAFVHSKNATRKLAQYRIVVEGGTFRVKGVAKGSMREVRFAMSDVQFVLAGVVPRSAFVAGHPLIRYVDARSLTIIEKDGSSISFVWALAVFSLQDLKAFFDQLRSHGVEAPTVGI